jgi:hypothetical protein
MPAWRRRASGLGLQCMGLRPRADHPAADLPLVQNQQPLCCARTARPGAPLPPTSLRSLIPEAANG